jgi:hypothetical protein
MDRRRRKGGVATAAMAAAGVVLGHWLAYYLAIPRPIVRTDVLARSGHGYWLIAVQLAVVLAVVALGSVVLSQVRAVCDESSNESEPYARLALRLAGLQIATFTVLEVTERALAGASLSGMFQHHVFLFGVAVQVLVALAGALILRWFGRAAMLVVRALLGSPRRARPITFARPPRDSFARPAVLVGAAGPRAPPSR